MSSPTTIAEIETPVLMDSSQIARISAEITAWAGGLAHEIRNPLSTINLNLELIGEDLADGESQRDKRILRKIELVQKECLRLEEILNDFLQFTHSAEVQTEVCNLNSQVQDFMEFYQPVAAAAGVEISPHLHPDIPLVRLDVSAFRQVLQNLAQNALQAMPKGGTLEVQTYARDGRACLELIDTGVGMTEQVLARIFDLYFSTRREGSGLGLPTVKRIVQAHSGTIDVQSEPGRGTRFTMTFPGLISHPVE